MEKSRKQAFRLRLLVISLVLLLGGCGTEFRAYLTNDKDHFRTSRLYWAEDHADIHEARHERRSYERESRGYIADPVAFEDDLLAQAEKIMKDTEMMVKESRITKEDLLERLYRIEELENEALKLQQSRK